MNEEMKFPFEIIDLEPEQNERLMKYFKGEYTGFVRVGPKGYFFPHKYRKEAAKIYNMLIRPSDVFVASCGRSGTTWMQELVWLVANDLDYETSNNVPLTVRVPFLEYSILIHPIMEAKFKEENSYSEEKSQLIDLYCQSGVDKLAKIVSPRFIKTHMPLSLMPPTLLDTAKMVYVTRDPRDVIVSFYYQSREMRTQDYNGDFKTFWNIYVQNMRHWTPFFENLKEAWAKRHHSNMLFLFYEELSKDLKASVRRVIKFFGKDFSEEQIDRLCNHLHIDNFKNNNSVNGNELRDLGIFVAEEQAYVRKGKVGGWREYFDDEMTQQAEQWIADNLQDTDLRFPHLEN